MTISITRTSGDQHRHSYDTIYDVTIDHFTVHTTVTRSAKSVSDWLQETDARTSNIRSNIVVGFDCKVRHDDGDDGRNPVAVILLCFSNRCLIYQVINRYPADRDHSALQSFFARASGYKLIGKNINQNASYLLSDYSLDVSTTKYEVAIDSRDDSMRDVREIAHILLKMELYPRTLTEKNNWEMYFLTTEQVKEAVTDVYLSYKIGTFLKSYEHQPTTQACCPTGNRLGVFLEKNGWTIMKLCLVAEIVAQVFIEVGENYSPEETKLVLEKTGAYIGIVSCGVHIGEFLASSIVFWRRKNCWEFTYKLIRTLLAVACETVAAYAIFKKESWKLPFLLHCTPLFVACVNVILEAKKRKLLAVQSQLNDTRNQLIDEKETTVQLNKDLSSQKDAFDEVAKKLKLAENKSEQLEKQLKVQKHRRTRSFS